MSKLNRRTALKMIIQAYRNGAYIIGVHMLTENSLEAKRNIRKFGPVNYTANRNGETIYGYSNEEERIRITQFVTKNIRDPKPDTRKASANHITEARQRELEKAIVDAYKKEAQFIVAYPPVNTEDDARRTLRFFGDAVQGVSDDGRTQYVVDDIENQVKAIVTIGFTNQY